MQTKTRKSKIKTYKDLIVWQKAMNLAVAVYMLTKNYPSDEKYGLVSQMRRAAVSIPSNIAEGKLRGGNKEARQFFLISFSSGGELETQIELSKLLPTIKDLDFNSVDLLLEEVMKMLNKFISNLDPNA